MRVGGAVSRARRGFTLAEAAVGAALFALLTGVLIGTLALSQRGERNAARERCLGAALSAQKQIEADLRRAVRVPHREPVSLTNRESADRIGLWICEVAADGAPAERLPLAGVVYRSDGRGLVRLAAGRVERPGGPGIRDVRFRRLDARAGVLIMVTLTAVHGEGAARHELTHGFSVRLRTQRGAHEHALDADPARFPGAELLPADVAGPEGA